MRTFWWRDSVKLLGQREKFCHWKVLRTTIFLESLLWGTAASFLFGVGGWMSWALKFSIYCIFWATVVFFASLSLWCNVIYWTDRSYSNPKFVEIWLLIMLGGATEDILPCQSIPLVIEICDYTTILTPPLWRQTRPRLNSGRVSTSGGSDSSSGKKKKKKRRLREKNQIKYSFVLYSSPVSLAHLRFPQGRGSLFLCAGVGLDEPFQIFCWMWESGCLGSSLCKQFS